MKDDLFVGVTELFLNHRKRTYEFMILHGEPVRLTIARRFG